MPGIPCLAWSHHLESRGKAKHPRTRAHPHGRTHMQTHHRETKWNPRKRTAKNGPKQTAQKVRKQETIVRCVIAQAFCSQKSFREITQNCAKLRSMKFPQITLNSAEVTLHFRELAESPWLKKAWAIITHPTTVENKRKVQPRSARRPAKKCEDGRGQRKTKQCGKLRRGENIP